MNYKQAFDRMTEHYISGKVNAYDCTFCFCGNLSGGNTDWKDGVSLYKFFKRTPTAFRSSAELFYNTAQPGHDYSPAEYSEMEKAFMGPGKLVLDAYIAEEGSPSLFGHFMLVEAHNQERISIPGYDDAIYEGFVAALEVLKQIHISKGEDIDDSLKLVKKQPVMA